MNSPENKGLEKVLSVRFRKVMQHCVWLLVFLSEYAMAEKVHWRITELGSDDPLPCRIHLMDSKGQPVRAPDLPFWRNHFNTLGEFTFDLAPDTYRFEILRGPEYGVAEGSFKVEEGAEIIELRHSLKCIAHMSEEGWWSGELHIHRPMDDVPLLMRSEDLHVGPVITWWNGNNPWKDHPLPKPLWREVASNRVIGLMGGEDERQGGALLFFLLNKPLPIQSAQREYPSPMVYLNQAEEQGGWIDIEKPFWRDVPAWIASGKVDSIGLANNHIWERGMLDNEAWGRARPIKDFPSPLGNGRWTQYLYYQILNAGIPLAPSAGSASGVLNNPVGYNRVYVHLKDNLNLYDWWDGLREGRSFVTNGPLLRCRVGEALPGSRLQSLSDGSSMHLKARLTSRDSIEAFEIIHNGNIIRRVPVKDIEGKIEQDLGAAPTEKPGWFLIRAVTSLPNTFRFASTAPFYVVDGNGNIPVHQEACQFFLDWTRERMNEIPLEDKQQRAEVMKYWKETEAFWVKRVSEAGK